MPRCRRQLPLRYPQILLPLPLLACAHRHALILRTTAVDHTILFLQESRLAPRAVSFVDPDLIYGTTSRAPLTITSYRFSSGVTTPVIDTRACGTRPALGTGPGVVSDDDVSLSADDRRISISEGGPQFGKHMFVIVYDKKLGCRWYNTQTGQIGGQWGRSGTAVGPTVSYLIRHAYLSRSGRY